MRGPLNRRLSINCSGQVTNRESLEGLMRGFLNYALIHCALLAWPAFAQMTTTGTINGTVTDPSGRAVPGASVTIFNEATKDVRSLTSGEGGEFNFTAIVPGSYSLKAERSGFKTLERTGVVVSANE